MTRAYNRPWPGSDLEAWAPEKLTFQRTQRPYTPSLEREAPLRGWGTDLLRLVGIIVLVIGLTFLATIVI